jgi:hypothetical protein
MPTFSAGIDDTRAIEHLESIPEKLRRELLSVEEVYKDRLVAEARRRAPVKTGAYLASISGVVYGSRNAVTATVRAGSKEAWYAHILEYGAHLVAHEILPNAKKALFFELAGGAGDVFAKHINFPGGEIAPRNILTGPFEALRPQIEAAIAGAADTAVEEK